LLIFFFARDKPEHHGKTVRPLPQNGKPGTHPVKKTERTNLKTAASFSEKRTNGSPLKKSRFQSRSSVSFTEQP